MKKYAEVLYMLKKADLESALKQIREARRLTGRKDTQAEQLLKAPPTPLNNLIDLPKGRWNQDRISAPDRSYTYRTPSQQTFDASVRSRILGRNAARRTGALQAAWKEYSNKRNNLLSRRRQQLPGGKWIGQLDPKSLEQIDKINHDKYLEQVNRINNQQEFLSGSAPVNDAQREQQRLAQIQYWNRQGAENKAQMQLLGKNAPSWERGFQDTNKKQLAKATMMNRPGSSVDFMSDTDPAFAQWAASEAQRQGISMPSTNGQTAKRLNPAVLQNLQDLQIHHDQSGRTYAGVNPATVTPSVPVQTAEQQQRMNNTAVERAVGKSSLKNDQMRINGKIMPARTNFNLSPEALAYYNRKSPVRTQNYNYMNRNVAGGSSIYKRPGSYTGRNRRGV